MYDDMAQFDPVRGSLLIGEGRLVRLVELVAHGTDPDGWSERWSTDGLVAGGRLHPLIEGIAQVAGRAVRTVTVERMGGGLTAPLLVAWDGAGRVTLSEATDDGRLAVRLSSFDLLPSLLMQELGLLRAIEGGDTKRVPLVADPADIEALLQPTATAGSQSDSQPVVPGVFSAWRAVGGWADEQPDSALVGLVAESGAWRVDVENPQSVRLEPTTVSELAGELGHVVTGANSARAAVSHTAADHDAKAS